MNQRLSFLPSFILKYEFKTDEFLSGVKVPVTIFHGDRDRVIPYASSLELQYFFKPSDTLITLHGCDHNGYIGNEVYHDGIVNLLK